MTETDNERKAVFEKKAKQCTMFCPNVKIRIYKTIILPVVLYGCETWSLTLREEHRLRLF
jgi:hypothetical protein